MLFCFKYYWFRCFLHIGICVCMHVCKDYVVTVPSPPHASIRRFGVSWNNFNLEQNCYRKSGTPSSTNTHPNSGPPLVKSNTWRGFSSHWNVCIKRAPWLPPLRGLMNTSNGLCWLDVSVGFIWNHITFSSILPQSNTTYGKIKRWPILQRIK